MALVTFVDGNVLEASELNDSFTAVNVIKSVQNAVVGTSQTTASTSFTDLSTVGPSITVTTGTSALVIITCGIGNSSNSGVAMYAGFAVSGASTVAASDTSAAYASYGAGAINGGSRDTVATALVITGLSAGSNTFTLKYRTSAGTATFADRRIQVLPL
jgi:hypothetical protein